MWWSWKRTSRRSKKTATANQWWSWARGRLTGSRRKYQSWNPSKSSRKAICSALWILPRSPGRALSLCTRLCCSQRPSTLCRGEPIWNNKSSMNITSLWGNAKSLTIKIWKGWCLWFWRDSALMKTFCKTHPCFMPRMSRLVKSWTTCWPLLPWTPSSELCPDLTSKFLTGKPPLNTALSWPIMIVATRNESSSNAKKTRKKWKMSGKCLKLPSNALLTNWPCSSPSRKIS